MDFDAPLVALGGLSPRTFLGTYWQKKPLLMRGAFPDASAVVSPDDIKRLAQDESLVSRLILQDGGDHPWQLRDGPFSPRELRTLRGTWALLVQEIDRVVPAARALSAAYSFIPRWRMDDVMVSLAPDGAGVGAHLDHYDVFLVQGAGQRRWRIGNAPATDDAVQEGLDVAVLERFAWTDEYVLDPGDVLYLPPRIAHEGVAMGECITLSIGFRAPSAGDLVAGWMEHLLVGLDGETFYADPDLRPTDRPGEITAEAASRARDLLLELVGDEKGFAEWFGRHLTEPRRLASAAFLDEAFEDDETLFDTDALDAADAASGDGALADAHPFGADDDRDGEEADDEMEDGLDDGDGIAYGDLHDYTGGGHPGAEAVADLVRGGLGVRHEPSARLAYLRQPGGEATLFANGHAFRLEADLAFAAALVGDHAALGAHDLLPHLGLPDFPDLLAALLDAEALEWDTDA